MYASGGFYDYTIEQSLRFDDGDSPALSKAYGTAQTNTKKLTISVWVKRGNRGLRSTILYAKSGSAAKLSFQTTDKLFFNAFNTGYNGFESNALFRDTTAWYHIVAQADSDGQTGANVNRVWVNGVELDNSKTSAFVPDDTATMLLRNGVTTLVGDDTDGAYHFDGYLAEMHVIDGSIVAPTVFGETKDGIWIPKEYTGSHGNNGFYLPMGATATSGFSADFDGSGDNIRWSSASQFDIASDDDYCLEFYTKGDFEANYSYGIGQYATGGPHFLLQMGANGIIYGYYGNGQANTMGDMTAHLTTTSWHHIAYVRESGTYRLYIDGVQRGTGSGGGTAAFDLSQFNIGDAHPAAGAAHFNGRISNLRFTIGAARYAGGTTFTVPTSTLTNDSSNVKLLAFTTATITADGSTAGITGSITEGDPVFTTDSPFSDLIGDDASSNTNDFIHSGLSFEDIVLDTPTNNFAVGNNLSSYSNNTFAEGNLKVTGSGVNYYNYLSSFGMETGGKYYFEVYSNKRNSSYWAVGICKPESFSHTMSVYNTAGSMALQQGQSVYYLNSEVGSATNRYNSTAYLFSFAIDLDNNIFHFRADGGTWENSGDPAAGTGGYAIASAMQGQTLMPWFGPNGSNYQVLNFGQDSSFAGNKTSGSANAADGNDIGDFYYAPPSGFLALASSNLPEPAIIDGTEHFNTVLYTGNGSSRSITEVGFSPDWIWFKARSAAIAHLFFDSVRGATKYLQVNSTSAEGTGADSQTSFDSDGFSLGADTSTTGVNKNSTTYVAWNWKAGTTASGSEVGNNPAFSSSSNADAGFSIVSYTGTGSAGTVSHGCGAKPTMIIIKNRDQADNWAVYHAGTASDPETDYMILNTVAAVADSANWWNDTAPTDSVFTVGTDHSVNADGEDYIAYCFADVDDYMKASHYIGNNTFNFVYTGFRPAFLMLKKTTASTTYGWQIYDTSRSPINVAALPGMWADTAAAETATTYSINIHSNGFRLTGAGTNQNASGVRYVYFAIADQPAKFSNAR